MNARIALLAGIALTAATSAWAQTPRFLCNGVNADGSLSSDGCNQPCDAAHAVRWQPGQVAYSYDKTTRPSQVSSTRWNNEIAAARQAWMSASPALALSDSGSGVPAHSASNPAFGVEDGSNSIYWVLTNNEWNASAGSDATAALGVTIALNNRCSSLDIFDADTILNGAPESNFDWSFNSSLGTLTHEMGHGLGLGHPCTDSCGALMEAASGGGPAGCGDTNNCFDPIAPQSSDIEGIQSLYPAPGALGSACNGGGCNSGLQCENVGGQQFCTQSCGTCPNGMVCSAVNGGSFCIFTSSQVAQVGDACGPPGCASTCPVGSDGFQSGANGCNLCLPISQTASQCFAGCDPNNPQCTGGAPCQPLQDQSGVTHGGACEPPGTAQAGQTCDGTTGCISSLECILNPGSTTTGTCFASCDKTTGVGCDNTSTCLAVLSDGSAICVPHGTLTEGAACDDTNPLSSPCGRGLICIPETQSGPSTCHGICSQGYTCPSAGEQCVSAGGSLSVCLAASTGEGEGEGSVGEGEGEGSNPPPGGGCRIRRGNFDCPNARDACVVKNPDTDTVGTCTGSAGSTKTFDECSTNDECTTGLCVDGVCTVPCDIETCPSGYTCDASVAPAGQTGGVPGVCVPDSCQSNHGVCSAGDGFHCVYTPKQHYACAKDGAPLCACTTTTSSTTPVAGVAAMLVGAALVVRRRRR